ncbi:MAG TPA: homoserine dehydrogenase [Thermoleophilia bacterium]|nr:homoserine dehydrogenase [Thermoleophilia bacterium]
MEEGEERKVRVGLLGFGTIGSSVYGLIEKERPAILEATGVDLRVSRILDIDTSKWGVDAPASLFTADFNDVVGDEEIDIVVELIGGIDRAFEFVSESLRRGKEVVTANKQLIANRGAALFDLAREEGRQLRFEASVGGAIPVIRVMREGMIAAGLHSVYGIVNGTTNYILTAMYEGEGGYADTLARAQELGYAEADPSADVGGGDAAAKMAILASIAYRSRVTMADVTYEGIVDVTLEDVRYAKDFGFVIKLVGAARLIDGKISVRVHPALVPRDHLLASINGSINAVYLQGHAIGEIMLTGPGAGGDPTATAVVGDVMTIAGTQAAGFLQNCSCYKHLEFLSDDLVESAFFIRMQVEDRAGVLAQISSVFGAHQVSIESMIQKGQGDRAELVFITYPSLEKDFFRAIETIAGFACVRSRPMTIRVL